MEIFSRANTTAETRSTLQEAIAKAREKYDRQSIHLTALEQEFETHKAEFTPIKYAEWQARLQQQTDLKIEYAKQLAVKSEELDRLEQIVLQRQRKSEACRRLVFVQEQVNQLDREMNNCVQTIQTHQARLPQLRLQFNQALIELQRAKDATTV